MYIQFFYLKCNFFEHEVKQHENKKCWLLAEIKIKLNWIFQYETLKNQYTNYIFIFFQNEYVITIYFNLFLFQ